MTGSVTNGKVRGLVPLAAGVALIIGCVLLYRLFAKPEAPSQALDRYFGCLERDDAACLYAGMSRKEREELGLSQSDFTRFYEGYVAGSFRGLDASGPPLNTLDVSRATAYRELLLSDGSRTVARSMKVVMTPEGHEIEDLVFSLLISAFMAKHSRPGEVKGEAWLAGLAQDSKRLEDLGIRAVYRESIGTTPLPQWKNEVEQRLLARRSQGNVR